MWRYEDRGGAPVGLRKALEQTRVGEQATVTLAPAAAFGPHFSGEAPPKRPGDLALDLYDVVGRRRGGAWYL